MPTSYAFATHNDGVEGIEDFVEEYNREGYTLRNIVDVTDESDNTKNGKVIRETLTQITKVESEFTKFSTENPYVLKIGSENSLELIEDEDLSFEVVAEYEKKVLTNRFIVDDEMILLTGDDLEIDKCLNLLSQTSPAIEKVEMDIGAVLEGLDVVSDQAGRWDAVDEYTDSAYLSGDVDESAYEIDQRGDRVWAMATIEYQDQEWNIGLSQKADQLVLYSPVNIRDEKVLEFVRYCILPNCL